MYPNNFTALIQALQPQQQMQGFGGLQALSRSGGSAQYSPQQLAPPAVNPAIAQHNQIKSQIADIFSHLNYLGVPTPPNPFDSGYTPDHLAHWKAMTAGLFGSK